MSCSPQGRRPGVAARRAPLLLTLGALALVSLAMLPACGGAPPPNTPEAQHDVPERELASPGDTTPDEPPVEPSAEPPEEESGTAWQAQPSDEVVEPVPAALLTPTPGRGPLELRLKVSPGDDLSVAEAESFYLAISVKNPTRNRVLHPDLPNSELLVNGKRLKYWAVTIADLPTTGVWADLPPGRTVEFIFKVAEKVRVKPGDYVFVLRTAKSASPSVRLHVRP